MMPYISPELMIAGVILLTVSLILLVFNRRQMSLH
jgi:hypothetical protein